MRRSLFLILVLPVLLISACAPNRTPNGVSVTVRGVLAPIVREALAAVGSAAQSSPLPAAPTSPSKTARTSTARPKSAATQAAPSPVALNGIALPVTHTAHEDIYAAPGVPSQFMQSVVADAGFAAQELMQDEGWTGAPHVSIFVFPAKEVWLQGIAQIGQLPASQVQFQAQLSGDAWLTISGSAHPGVYLYPIQQSSFDMLHMLAHEYTHVIQRQVIGDTTTVPDWFIEGMAEAEGWRIAGQTDARAYAQAHAEVVTIVRFANRRRGLLPLTSISTQQSWQARMESPRAATLEYAESQLAIEYLQQIKGSSAPMSILQGAAAQHSFDAAFQQVAQMTITDFQSAFEKSLR